MIYLTFNDHISGIYKGQVIDVLYALNKVNKSEIRLISFFSIRYYFQQRKKLKNLYPNSVSFPMFPKLRNWKWNTLFLKLFIKKEDVVICRGVFAANIAFKAFNKAKVIYDGRGAISEEFKEYNVGGFSSNEILEKLERKAVLESFFRIAVSNKLVEYWESKFGYNFDNHIVIPCTLSSIDSNIKFTITREDLNFSNDDIVIVFSGGTGLWQSYSLMLDFLEKFLLSNSKIKVLLLCKENSEIDDFVKKYKERIYINWVSFSVVSSYLDLADYGIVAREESVTNFVSSPVKIAEYLSCGLKILISQNIGDFSKFIFDNKLGYILEQNNNQKLSVVSELEKKRIRTIAQKFFSKKSIYVQEKYERLNNKLIS